MYRMETVMRGKCYQNLIIILSVLILSACGGEDSVPEPFAVTMMMEQFPMQEAMGGGTWLKAIEQETDTKLQFEMIPTLEYVSQVERMIRNDRLPMVMVANQTVLEKEVFHVYLNAGGFWQLDDYLDDYPALKAFVGAEVWENSKIQGHIYGIPRLRIRPRNGAYYRADWAETLGIPPPETLDEIYEMLKAFTEQDPDGNGLDDTVGLANCWQNPGNRGWNGVQTITTALGGPNGWEYSERDGVMIPDFATEQYLEMLTWFRKLYQEGVMEDNFSFLTAVQRQERFTQGNVGMIFGVIEDAAELEDQIRRVDPAAKVALLPMIRAAGTDYRVNSTKGYNGLIMFNCLGDGAVRSEAELRRILEFYNMLCTEKGQELLVFGREGEHHVVEADGEKHLLYESGNNISILTAQAGSYIQIMPTPAYTRTAGDSELQRDIYDCIETREQWLVWDDTDALYSGTYLVLGDVLNRKIQKAGVRYILGEITGEDYRKAYEDWYDSGGKQVIEEYTAEYQRWNKGVP